jgi:hypothetical protein
MTNFNEQVIRIWDEWEETTGEEANNPDDFVAWAMENKKLLPRLQDIQKILRKQVTGALRQAMRTDENGITYRAKQCVLISEEGTQLRLWFDSDKGGTPNLRQKAVRQRCDGIANDVYRAVCDVDHMNHAFPSDPQLSFLPDFTEDCAEKRAAEQMSQNEEEGDKAA